MEIVASHSQPGSRQPSPSLGECQRIETKRCCYGHPQLWVAACYTPYCRVAQDICDVSETVCSLYLLLGCPAIKMSIR